MTKQEEIREIIWKFLVDYDKNNNPAVDWAFILLHRLAEKGVVIKVEGELPKNPYRSIRYKYAKHDSDKAAACRYVGYENARKDMAGFTAVEPLRKE